MPRSNVGCVPVAAVRGEDIHALIALLQQREGDIVHGKPVTPKVGKLTFDDAAADLLADYRTNAKRSLVVVDRRVKKHLTSCSLVLVLLRFRWCLDVSGLKLD